MRRAVRVAGLAVAASANAVLLLWALAANQSIGRLEGLLLVGLLAAYTIYVIRASRRQTAADRQEAAAPPVVAEKSWDPKISGSRVKVALVRPR